MRRVSPAQLWSARNSPLVRNLAVRAGAMLSLAVATLLVAHAGGPVAVGDYALLRVLPWLCGVVAASGLPQASTYFLAGPRRAHPRLRSTLTAITIAGGLAGGLLWALASPLIRQLFFPNLSLGLVALAGVSVFTELLVVTAKACSQGEGDMAGSDRVILLEELAFLPAFGALLWLGGSGPATVLAGLILADVAVDLLAWSRLARRGFFRGWARPSLSLAREICSYGARGEAGSVLFLFNLRLDFAILGAIAGPAILGTYAVASKFAELLRIPPLALNWVLYPRYARADGSEAAAHARATMPWATGLTVAIAIPLGLAAGFVIPGLYGTEFQPAVLPALILLVGLIGEGVAAVVTAFLFGNGRPGLNSISMAAGLLVTVAGDLLLVPGFGAVGAAVASSAAYLTTTGVLLACFRARARSFDRGSADPQPDGGPLATHRSGAAVRLPVSSTDEQLGERP
jgi:O-antigen/teichoic acid export membrane protein